MSVTVQVNASEVLIGLGELRTSVADRSAMLKIAGNLMRASVANTFRDEGSPAGSWPRLALSTLRNKKYKAGHKLLIMSGRLFGSITYVAEDGTLTIGTNVRYAAVQQFGSADYRGQNIGPLGRADSAYYDALRVKVKAHEFLRTYRASSGDIRGKGPAGRTRKLVSGIRARRVQIAEHYRRQNIPPRPFLVFRPDDPQNIASGIEAYLARKAKRIGTVTGGAA